MPVARDAKRRLISLAFLLFNLAVTGDAYGLAFGDRVRTNATVNVRSSAAGTAIGSQSSGSLGTISAGPQTASLSGTFYTWWYVNFDVGTDGWVADIGIDTVASAPGAFSLWNDAPFWDSRVPAGPAVQLHWSASSGATGY